VELGSGRDLRDFESARAGHVLGAVAMLGLLGLILISLPRISSLARLSYERWLLIHRLIGLLLVVGLIHGWMLDPVLSAAPPLRALYTIIGAAGVAAYAYDELLRRRMEPRADYTIRSVDRPAPGTLDLTLAPVAASAGLRPKPGQFVYLRVECARPSREHPFSVAGAYADGTVRLTIRALGRETRRFYAELHRGMPARLSGPYGLFDFSTGGPRQLWIAGGIGIAPFLGWATQQVDSLPKVDLFYSAPTTSHMPFLNELTEAAEHNPSLTVHPHFSDRDGPLTADAIVASVDSLPHETDVFLCGPASMVKDIGRGLQLGGIARDRIHAEHLAFR